MRYFLVLLTLFFTLTSCSDNTNNVVISKDFDNEEWQRFDYLQGDFEVSKVPSTYQIIMEVVVSETFPNIYKTHHDEDVLPFNMTIFNPNDNGMRSRNYSFKLKDQDGNWKADNKNGYYHFKLPVNEMTFSEEGIYNFKIENKYHKDPLYGIKSLTLKCIN